MKYPLYLTSIGKRHVIIAIFILLWNAGFRLAPATAQDQAALPMAPPDTISLHSLDAFQPTGQNWQIAGGITSDHTVDRDLKARPGEGILVNTPTKEQRKHLFTEWTHGDLELELDFLMAKGSNSGIYLMGRYEVQLLDSWGVENPGYGDCGGIYQRWDDNRPAGQQGFEGHAPSRNASLAPGLWQHLTIHFRAPEFNVEGEKTANAKFDKVWLNGMLIQQNVEVTGPTRSAAFSEEQPQGPLMIQGDHGPVAIRNISYKKYSKLKITLHDLRYRYYEDDRFTSISDLEEPSEDEVLKEIRQDSLPDFNRLTSTESGPTDSLFQDLGKQAERYGLEFIGSMRVPTTGEYVFRLQVTGLARLQIDGVTVLTQEPFEPDSENNSFDDLTTFDDVVTGRIRLKSGSHSFRLAYKNHFAQSNVDEVGLALYAAGPGMRLQPFHRKASLPNVGKQEATPSLVIEPHTQRPRILRSFARFQGEARTHVVNVGAPDGINFNYDMGQASLLSIWGGRFVDVGQMWIDRGQSRLTDQIAQPVGVTIPLAGKPLLAYLGNDNPAWPDSISWDSLEVEGYNLDAQGWPAFAYHYGPITVEDHLSGSADSRHIMRTLTLAAPQVEPNLWVQLTAGSQIEQQSERAYVVDDRSYYLEILENKEGVQPVIRDGKKGQQLLVPVLRNQNKTTLKYVLIW